jgi:predicted transcriptional regulator of viral defense system
LGVPTTRPIRSKEQTVPGTSFVLKHAREAATFGTRPVWRGQAKVAVSSPAKTIIDMLEDPALGGGIRHVSDCLDEFLKEVTAPAKELIAIADRLVNARCSNGWDFSLSSEAAPTTSSRRVMSG